MQVIERAAKEDLQSLDLRSKQLSSLPPEIGKLTSLRSLDLSINQLSSLPPEIVKLTSLQSLSLRSNQLSSLPPEIVKLASQGFELIPKVVTGVRFVDGEEQTQQAA